MSGLLFGIWVPNALLIRDGNAHEFHGLVVGVDAFVCHPGVPGGVGLALLIADRAGERQMLLVVLDRLAGITNCQIRIAEIAKRIAFAPASADVARELELLLIVLYCPGDVARCAADDPKISKRNT